MKWLLIPVFGIAALWGGFTTVYGTWSVLGSGSPEVVVSVLVAIVVLALLLNSASVFKGGNGPGDAIWGILWLIALGYDLYTSYLGNRDLLLSESVGEEQQIVLIGLTILVSGSPILLSFLIDQLDD